MPRQPTVKKATIKKPTIRKHNLSISKPLTSTYLRIYRKTVSNLKIREALLKSKSSEYKIGPTIIWTEDAVDLGIFTTAENYSNFIGFEEQFSNPKSPKFLKTILLDKNMRMSKGSILIKEATPVDAMHIPVHFCAYRIDNSGKFTIFDPSWHAADPGIYSTTAFYDSLDAFGISYTHAEPERTHHWQSVLPNDVFCQTWTLQWLLDDYPDGTFPLPRTRTEASRHIASYIKYFANQIKCYLSSYMSLFPAYKLEGNVPMKVFRTIVENQMLMKNIYDLF